MFVLPVDQEIERDARQVRMPRRHWARLRVAGAERRAMAARLASGGESFGAALDELERRAGELGLTVLQPVLLNADAAQPILDLRPDALVWAAYGNLIPRRLIDGVLPCSASSAW